jgi:hypothetical protein
MEKHEGPTAALLYGAAVAHMEASGTNLWLSRTVQERLEQFAALAEEYSADFELGLGLSTVEAIAAARKQT